MDLLYFLRQRLTFVRNLYEAATLSFRETIRKIDAGEQPYFDGRNLDFDDVSEPLFLEEYQEAGESVEVIGHWCLCMVHASFKAYLGEVLVELQRDFRPALDDLPVRLASTKAKNWFDRYRLFFREHLGIDWQRGPIELDKFEHLNLTRDDLTHNIDVMSTLVYQTEQHAEKHPKGLFVDEAWSNLDLGGRIRVGRDELIAAIGMVTDFCTWLEEIRVHYAAYLKSLEEADRVSDGFPPDPPER